MASVNWLKATTQKAGGMKKHLGQKEREEGNHSNEHINKELTGQNYVIGCADYSQALERMKTRTREVDEIIPPKRIRKDRVTCCFLELPCPRELTEQRRSDEFFQKAHSLYADFFGSENVHGTFVHKDEVHKYTDKHGNQQMSCEHSHTLVSAFTTDKGINGKAFETRAKIKALNTAMDDMCMREFGIHLNTGEHAERKSVETLKQESEARQELGQLQSRVDELQRAEVESRDRFLEADERATEREIEADKAVEQAKKAENRTEKAKKELGKINSEYDVASQELKKVLDMKVRASEINKISHLFGETVEYNKTMLDSTRNIGNKALENLKKAKVIREEAAALKRRADNKEQEIAPLHRQAEETVKEAKRERQRAEQLRQQQEELIEKRSKEIAEQAVHEGLRGVTTSRTERLESFLKRIELGDGKTAYQLFEEQEHRREQEALERAKQQAEFERRKRKRSWDMDL